MIPILFSATETEFISGGLGFLTDAISCKVREERNGAYECELEYPVMGCYFKDIKEDCIIFAKPNETKEPQPFRIYDLKKTIDGTVTFFAEHISYQLSALPIEHADIIGVNAAGALQTILNASLLPHQYSCWSDIDTINSTKIDLVSVRAALGGVDGSILDTYGGEFEFDRYTIKLHKNRGKDTGIIIAYGKNLVNLDDETSITEVFTGIYPYVKKTKNDIETLTTLPEKIIYNDKVSSYGYKRVLMKDFSDKFGDEAITDAVLRAIATDYLTNSVLSRPKVSQKIEFINLWQQQEYELYSLLERVSLCDMVTVQFEDLNVLVKAKVVKTEYDCLSEKYLSINIGEVHSDLAGTVSKNGEDVKALSKLMKSNMNTMYSTLDSSIKNATELITGNQGGNVVLNPAEKPQEILVMDTPDIATAVNVWRMNSAGFGHSSSGYNGPYELAITADGTIVADFIKAGTLDGTLVKAGTIMASAISQAYKSQVTEEINGKTQELNQSFIVANETLQSLIQQLNTNIQNEVAIRESKTSQLQQDIDAFKFSFDNAYGGGSNIILNSAGLNGIDDSWLITGTVNTLQSADTKNMTVSDSCFVIMPGSTLKQEINSAVSGPYTITLLFKKLSTSPAAAVFSVTHDGITEPIVNTSALVSDWTESSITFMHTAGVITIQAEFNVPSTYSPFYISDIMMVRGDKKFRWTPAPNEIYTEQVKIDKNGVEVTNSGTSQKTVMTHREFAGYYENIKTFYFNKDETHYKRGIVEKDQTVGKVQFIPKAIQSEGLDIVLLD